MNAAQRRLQRRALAREWPAGTIAMYFGQRVRVEGRAEFNSNVVNVVGVERGKRLGVSIRYLARVPS